MEDNNLPQNLSNDEVIDLFIDGIMTEKGVAAPTDEIHDRIHKELRDQLMTELDRALVAALPEEKLDELYKIAEESGGKIDPQLVAQAINATDIDSLEVTGVTMNRFRNVYLGIDPDAESPEVSPNLGTDADNNQPTVPEQNQSETPEQNPDQSPEQNQEQFAEPAPMTQNQEMGA